MSLLCARGLCALGALLTLVTTAVAQPGSMRAFDVQIDGCVLPGKACDPADEVIKMRVGEREVSFALDKLIVIRGGRSGGWVRDELRRRPLRAYGPDEVLNGLRPGARVRLSATLRLSEGLVLVRAVNPAEEPGADTPPAQESPR